VLRSKLATDTLLLDNILDSGCEFRLRDAHGLADEITWAQLQAEGIVARDKDWSGWLNDEAINCFMLHLQFQEQQAHRSHPGRGLKVHYFKSFFFSKLVADDASSRLEPELAWCYTYNMVATWTRPKALARGLHPISNVFECDLLVVPVNLGQGHWVCAVINLVLCRIEVFDSCRGTTACPVAAELLIRWVADEARDKLGQDWDMRHWQVIIASDAPRQYNGCDCGVFTCMAAEYRGQGKPFDYTDMHVPACRMHIMHAIYSMPCKPSTKKLSLGSL
jgi:Ulp1 family protease